MFFFYMTALSNGKKMSGYFQGTKTYEEIFLKPEKKLEKKNNCCTNLLNHIVPRSYKSWHRKLFVRGHSCQLYCSKCQKY